MPSHHRELSSKVTLFWVLLLFFPSLVRHLHFYVSPIPVMWLLLSHYNTGVIYLPFCPLIGLSSNCIVCSLWGGTMLCLSMCSHCLHSNWHIVEIFNICRIKPRGLRVYISWHLSYSQVLTNFLSGRSKENWKKKMRIFLYKKYPLTRRKLSVA